MVEPSSSQGRPGGQDAADIEALISTDPAAASYRLRAHLVDNPFDAAAYRALARVSKAGLTEAAPLGGIRSTIRFADTFIERASQALAENDFALAGVTLQKRLFDRPEDADALALMATVAICLNYVHEGEQLLRLALDISPALVNARIELARLFDRRDRAGEALDEIQRVLRDDPGNLFARSVQAEALSRAGRYADAVQVYEQLLAVLPEEAQLWTSFGHVLRVLGRTDEAIEALRRATRLSPLDGDAWWDLANLKTFRFDPAEVTSMQHALEHDDLPDAERSNIHFALGKAFEDSKSLADSFSHYDHANALARRHIPYAAEAIASEVERSIKLYSKEFFERRKGWGAAAADPIFIIGMPRAGSTLVEQILASHPSVEGTRELLNIPNIAIELAGGGTRSYLEAVQALDREAVLNLGERYLRDTGSFRVLGRPRFTDKLPDNWFYVGLILLLLPNAKIVDARRHPLACGWSNFKQNYGTQQAFSYDLKSIGQRYRLYVRLLAHFDAVLPGRVHRVIHEQLVTEPEAEIRRLLEYLELPYDPACLRFHETDRAVRTPSSEQVRRPFQTAGLESWRAFEPWLGPLKETLGAIADCYPDVPPGA